MSRRIESQTSRTAEYTCLVRCLSYLEQRTQYKSDDYISLVIMNGLIRQLLQFSIFRRYFKNSGAPGMYEYVIARTKYIDREFKSALEKGIEQILIFGAGFDSRGIRFGKITRNTRIFELDAQVTQSAKINRYRHKKIELPENLIFVPIDFDRESLPDRLMQENFAENRPCLFILEGLTMYLQSASVDDTFRVIQEFAGTGSRVVFDFIYGSVLRQENLYEGEQELYNGAADYGESFCFGIEKGNVDEFVTKYGFSMIEKMDGEALEDTFFRNEHGELVGRVNKTHCLVTAERN